MLQRLNCLLDLRNPGFFRHNNSPVQIPKVGDGFEPDLDGAVGERKKVLDVVTIEIGMAEPPLALALDKANHVWHVRPADVSPVLILFGAIGYPESVRTTARERGPGIIDLQNFAGHSDPRTTLTYIRNRGRPSRSPAYVLKY